MAALHSCPRCTQALPASAAYCRRCGAAVDWSTPARVANAPTQKPNSLFSALLTALLIVAIMFGGLVFFRVHAQQPSVQYTPAYYNPPVPQTYPQPESQYPAYSPAQIVPAYPGPDGRDTHYHDHDDHHRDQHH